MIINLLTPHGFCGGVKNAIKIAKDSIKNNEQIYSLGYLIHNKNIVDELSSYGINTIDNDKTRLELLDEVKGKCVLITAHGASPMVFKKAEKLGFKVIDTTCPNVKEVHKIAHDAINHSKNVIYIGNKKHPETEGVLGISDQIVLLENPSDIDKIEISDNTICLNQTTLSLYDIADIHKKILNKNPNVKIYNSICNATTLRQKAVIEAPKCDLFIIIGDRKSSNTKKLFSLALKKSKAIMIESIDDILNYDFADINVVNVTAGASTPEYITKKVIEYLKQK